MYFHDGLDIVVNNGTPIYAIKSGFVKAIISGNEYYSSVVIEDKDTPGFVWIYTHVYYFKIKVGDYVPQGTQIAEVHFQGLPHVHLSRAYLAPHGSWDNYYDWCLIQPDTFFVFKDTKPPVIEKLFYYFRNNSDSLFQHGNPTIVSGEVDIVVGIRDQGEYAHSKDSDFGDRLCISRIEYEIAGEKIEIIYKKSFDFSKIILRMRPEFGLRDYERVLTVFKFYRTIHPEKPKSWDKIFSYYVITNTDGSGEFGEIDPSDQNYSWDTTAKNDAGNPFFPNGEYVIKVTAYDFKGNKASSSERVQVRNEGSTTVLKRRF